MRMKDVIKSKNVVSIHIKKVDRHGVTSKQQHCIRCRALHSRTKLYIVKDAEGNTNRWHPKCFNLHYGKAVKPDSDSKAAMLLKNFLVKEEKSKKAKKGKKSKKLKTISDDEETIEETIEETVKSPIKIKKGKKHKKSKKIVEEETSEGIVEDEE